MKKLMILLVLLLAFQGVVFGQGDSEKKVVLTYAHVVMPETTLNKAALKFKEIVERESNGSMVVEVHPASALGTNREVIEGLQNGTIAITTPAIAPVSQFTDATALFDLPFLFSEQKYAQEIMRGDIGKAILEELKDVGMTGLGYFTQGFRHTTNSRNPIYKVNDLEGLKVRTMENPAHIAMFNGLGASAVPMSFSEVFTALQQKTIDGQENPYENIKLSGFAEVQMYISETGHIYDPCPFLISTAVWNSLTSEQQEIVQNAVNEARDYQLVELDKAEAAIKAELQVNNTVIEADQIDRKAMMMASIPVYERFLEKARPERVKKALEIQGEYGKDLIKALGL